MRVLGVDQPLLLRNAQATTCSVSLINVATSQSLWISVLHEHLGISAAQQVDHLVYELLLGHNPAPSIRGHVLSMNKHKLGR